MSITSYQNLIAIACLAALTGCATITKDTFQPIKVETYSKDNQMIENVKCFAKNDRGQYNVQTPGNLVAHRSDENLEIKCEMESLPAGYGTVISRTNGSMFGNILFGGGIGAIIDHNKGTAYNYPDWIRIIMGDNLVYDRKANKDNEVMIGRSANPDELKSIAEDKAKEKAKEEASAKKAAEQQKTSSN